MIVRALDANHDWTYGKGKNDYKYGVFATAQNIQTRLYSFLGDCFFNTSAGIDWFNLLGAKSQINLNLAVNAMILNTPNVTGLQQLSIDLDEQTRNITMTYTVQTSYGTISDIFQFDVTV